MRGVLERYIRAATLLSYNEAIRGSTRKSRLIDDRPFLSIRA